MKSARQFVQEYFKNESHFFDVAAQSGFFPHVDQPEREVILDASESGGTAVVTASMEGDHQKQRFSLQRESGSWSFTRIETECICRVTGKQIGCEWCAAKGWNENYRRRTSMA
jgi:hypothetical protein